MTLSVKTLALCQVTEDTANSLSNIDDLIFTMNSQLATPTLRKDTSSTPVSKVWGGIVTLSAGALTVDLTSLSRSPYPTVTLSSLKPYSVYLYAPTTNTNSVSVTVGASNGYADLGTIKVFPGQEVLLILGGTQPSAVDSSHKNLDLSSSMGAAQLVMLITAG